MDGETIVAVATPAGVGGVGVIRMSGARAVAIVAELVGRPADALRDRMLTRAVVRDGAGARLDDALVVVMRAPRSYTGEDVGEIHAHGGAANLRRIVRAAVAAGARLAEPGEFTRRAFASGKLDLTEVEAVVDVIEAGSQRALRVAQAQLGGELGRRVRALRGRAVALLAELEASIDFPDEDLELGGAAGVAAQLHALAEEVGALAATHAWGRVLRDGIAVALVGEVNAGKSSLFNRLVGEERAIVTPEPGTTRDFVEARVVWDGVPVTLIDTAGTRAEAGSAAERRGIELSARRAAAADVRVVVHEAPRAPARAPDGAALHVVSKGDLGVGPTELVVTSAATGAGLDALRSAVLARVDAQPGDGDEGAVVTSERQQALLGEARSALARSADAVAAGAELAAVDARAAAEALAQILGERVGEDVLDALFARFCIGK